MSKTMSPEKPSKILRRHEVLFQSHQRTKRDKFVLITQSMIFLQGWGFISLISKIGTNILAGILKSIGKTISFVLLKDFENFDRLKLAGGQYIRNMNGFHPVQPFLGNVKVDFYGYVVDYQGCWFCWLLVVIE